MSTNDNNMMYAVNEIDFDNEIGITVLFTSREKAVKYVKSQISEILKDMTEDMYVRDFREFEDYETYDIGIKCLLADETEYDIEWHMFLVTPILNIESAEVYHPITTRENSMPTEVLFGASDSFKLDTENTETEV